MAPATTFAERLARAIEVMRPAGRGPWTAREIAEGTGLTTSYINFLLSGARGRRVSQQTVDKLAAFLGVPSDYFTLNQDPATIARIEEQLASVQLLAALRRAEVKTIAARLGDLSEADLRLVAELVDRLQPPAGDSAAEPGPGGRGGRTP